MDLETPLLKIIRGEKKAPFIMAGLASLSVIYRSLIGLRNWAYDKGVLPSTQLSVPVVSIGNIAVGGTGKTPLVHLLALKLQDKARVAILTRGFRSKIEKSGQIQQISSGSGPLCSSQECGDEPFLLAQKTKTSIWVGADRIASGQQAILQGANCLVLDDGMQHRRLKRDFEIVVVDGNDPFFKGRFVPYGLLRDSPKRLRNANLIVATRVKDEEHYHQLKKQIAHYSAAPLVATQVDVLKKQAIQPSKVGVFCGIGQPSQFLQTARDLKSEIVDTLILKDHGSLKEGQLQTFAESCRQKGAEALLCTEKDVVKLSSDFSVCLPIIPVEIQLKIIAGKEHWENLIENILAKVTHER